MFYFHFTVGVISFIIFNARNINRQFIIIILSLVPPLSVANIPLSIAIATPSCHYSINFQGAREGPYLKINCTDCDRTKTKLLPYSLLFGKCDRGSTT